MRNFYFILISSFILFYFAPKNNKFKRNFTNLSSSSSISSAYLLGNKKSLSKDIKKAHKKLHLQHLMTPSGLHLGALVLPLFLVIKSKKVRFILLFIFGIILSYIGGFNAMTRMAWFGCAQQLQSKSIWISFFVSFLLDILLGGLHHSYLSFTMSYLFFGIILSLRNIENKNILYGLFIGQCIVAYFFKQSVYPIGFFIGSLITAVFPVIFPLFIIDQLINLSVLKIYEEILLWASQLSILKLNISLTSLIIIIASSWKKEILLLFILSIPNLNNTPNYLVVRQAHISPAPRDIVKKKYFKWGTKTFHEDSLVCFNRLYLNDWSTHCYLK